MVVVVLTPVGVTIQQQTAVVATELFQQQTHSFSPLVGRGERNLNPLTSGNLE